MASKFRKYSNTSCEETLYRMYDYIVNSGQTALRLVNDTGSAVALYTQGVGFRTSWASASDCPDGSYLVVEPVTAIGSVRWQWRLSNVATNVLKTQFAPRGGWTNGSASFPGATSNDVQWSDGSAPGAGSQVYIGGGTFAINGSTTGTFLWVNIRDTGNGSADQMIYGGHYYPFSISYDVNPCCVVVGIPRVANEDYSWGRNSSDGVNNNRVGVEPAQTTSMVSAGYARVCHTDIPGIPGATCIIRDGNSSYVPLPAYLWRVGSALMGHFGDHMRICDGTLNDYDTDSNSEHLVIGHLWMHYDETL